MHISQTFIDPPSIFVSLVMLHRQGLRLTPILVLVEGWTREGRTVLLDASKLFANDTDVDSETLTVTKVGDAGREWERPARRSHNAAFGMWLGDS